VVNDEMDREMTQTYAVVAHYVVLSRSCDCAAERTRSGSRVWLEHA
jgi:hypothetical protein